MGLVDWFKNTSFSGKIVRDVGKVKLPSRLGSASFRLQELKPLPDTGERRYLLVITRMVLLRYQAQVITLTHSQLDTLRALLDDGLSAHHSADPRSVVSPASFS